MFASEASNPRSGLDIDAEHGSGAADPEGVEFRCVNPVAPARGEGVRAAIFARALVASGAERLVLRRP
jgi:hypothetical protein